MPTTTASGATTARSAATWPGPITTASSRGSCPPRNTRPFPGTCWRRAIPPSSSISTTAWPTRRARLWHIADGSYWLDKRWNLGEEYWAYDKNKLWSKLGFPVHHANESQSQVGALISCFSNRDAQNHSHSNFGAAGIPIELLKEIAGEEFGSPDAIDAPMNYTPMNQGKAELRQMVPDPDPAAQLADPVQLDVAHGHQPAQVRKYRGDTALEAKFYSLVTGIPTTQGRPGHARRNASFTLFRALTVGPWAPRTCATAHDQTTAWVVTAAKGKDGKDIPPFTPGTDRMTQEDMEMGRTLVYKAFGWDEKTGAPTKATLEALACRKWPPSWPRRGFCPPERIELHSARRCIIAGGRLAGVPPWLLPPFLPLPLTRRLDERQRRRAADRRNPRRDTGRFGGSPLGQPVGIANPVRPGPREAKRPTSSR